MGPPEQKEAPAGLHPSRSGESPCTNKDLRGSSVGTAPAAASLSVSHVDGCSVDGGPWSITTCVVTEETDSDDTEEVSNQELREKTKKSRDFARHGLRSKLQGLTGDDRLRGCGRRCVSELGAHVSLKPLADGHRAKWGGLLRCGRVHVCPVCSAEIRARRRVQVVRAVRRMMETRPDLQIVMVTFTIGHRSRHELKMLLDGLKKAYRRMRQSGVVSRMFKRMVHATIRAFEFTHGGNGWHPHIHVLLQTEKWSDEQKAELTRTWRRIVVEMMGGEHCPDEAIGVVWSRPIKSAEGGAYLAKLGLEMTWGEKKPRAQKSRGIWTIARHACEGDAQSVALWLEYEKATKGLRVLELDDRAAQYAKEQQEIEEHDDEPCARCGHARKNHHLHGGACEGTKHPRAKARKPCEHGCASFVSAPIEEPRETKIHVDSYSIFLLSFLERTMPGCMWLVLRDVEARPLEAALVIEGWISLAARTRAEFWKRKAEKEAEP